MLASEKNLAKNYQLCPTEWGEVDRKKKIPLRDLFRSNGHSFEAALLRDSCKTAQRHI